MSRVFNKSVKMLILTLLSVIVVSVSATTYFSLIMEPGVTIVTAAVQFKEGSDWDASWTLGTNNTWCSMSLNAYPNATLTYGEPLNLTNGASAVQMKLTTVSISPASGNAQVSNFTFINFTLYDETGSSKGSLNYTTSGDTWSTPSMGYTTMDANDEWYITIQTKAVAGATGNIVANIQIAVDVQE